LTDSVLLMGHLGHDELIELYNVSEIFALSSKSEGFPKVLLEAMACGCKIVTTPVGSVPEIMKGGNFLTGHEENMFARTLVEASDSTCQELFDTYDKILKKYDWCSVKNIYMEVMGK